MAVAPVCSPTKSAREASLRHEISSNNRLRDKFPLPIQLKVNFNKPQKKWEPFCKGLKNGVNKTFFPQMVQKDAKGMKVVSQHMFFIRKCMIVSSMDLPSRELICPTVPPWESQIIFESALGGDMLVTS